MQKAEAQRTIHVPGDASTIQGGINAAANGDTVLVAPGTYTEVLNFNGKNITVTSSNGPASTIIDGNQMPVVVTFNHGETRSAVISGFTIEHAAMPNPNYIGEIDGIFVDQTSGPTIQNNIITNNQAFGVHLNGPTLLTGNTISNTTTALPPAGDFGCDYNDGVGVNLYGPGQEVSNNIIENNLGHCYGGGMQLNNVNDPVIKNNIIRNNQSLGYGGAIAGTSSTGMQILQNLVYGNTAGATGGGLYIALADNQVAPPPNPLITVIAGNTLVGNQIVLNPNLIHSDIVLDGSEMSLGGVQGQIGLFNNIVISGDNQFSTIACNANNLEFGVTAAYNDIFNSAGSTYSSTCTVQPNAPGNFAVNPQFIDSANANYHLQSGSSLIDAGVNYAPGVLSTDFDGNPRIQKSTGVSLPTIDIGAYEFAGTPDTRSSSQTVLNVPSQSLVYGTPFSLTGTVTSTTTVNAGNVTFYDIWSPLGSASVNPSGGATFAPSSPLAVGTHILQAAYTGSSTIESSLSAPVTVTVTGFSTNTVLTLPSVTAYAGLPFTLSAKVTSTSGSVPTGSVRFIALIGTIVTFGIVPLDATGTATLPNAVINLAGGNDVQAFYLPTGGFLNSSSSNTPFNLQPQAFSIALTSSVSTIVQGQSVTLNAQYTPTIPGGVIPTSFPYASAYLSDNGSISGAGIDGGTYQTTFIPLAAGLHNYSIVYTANQIYAAAQSNTVNVTVQDFSITPTNPSLTLTAGQMGSLPLSLTPLNGLTGQVVFTCSVHAVLTDITCSVAPVQLDGSGTATATINLSTIARTSGALSPGKSPRETKGMYLATVLFFGLPLCCYRRRNSLPAGMILLFVVGSITSCSSGTSNSGSGTPTGTPANTYAISINAQCVTASHPVYLTLTVR